EHSCWGPGGRRPPAGCTHRRRAGAAAAPPPAGPTSQGRGPERPADRGRPAHLLRCGRESHPLWPSPGSADHRPALRRDTGEAWRGRYPDWIESIRSSVVVPVLSPDEGLLAALEQIDDLGLAVIHRALFGQPRSLA